MYSGPVIKAVDSKPRSTFFEPTRAKPAAPALSLVAPLAAASSASPRDSLNTHEAPVTPIECTVKKEPVVDVAAAATSLDIPEPSSPTLSCASSISSAPSSPIFDSDASSFTSQPVEEVQRSDVYWIKRDALHDILACVDERLCKKGVLRHLTLADVEAYALALIEQEETYELAFEASRGNNRKFEEDEFEREERLCRRLDNHISHWLERHVKPLDALPPFDPKRPVAQTFSPSRLACLDSSDSLVDMPNLRARLSLPRPARETMKVSSHVCKRDTVDFRRALAQRSCNIAEYKAQQRIQRAFAERARPTRGPAKRAMPIAQRRVPSSAPRFD